MTSSGVEIPDDDMPTGDAEWPIPDDDMPTGDAEWPKVSPLLESSASTAKILSAAEMLKVAVDRAEEDLIDTVKSFTHDGSVACTLREDSAILHVPELRAKFEKEGYRFVPHGAGGAKVYWITPDDACEIQSDAEMEKLSLIGVERSLMCEIHNAADAGFTSCRLFDRHEIVLQISELRMKFEKQGYTFVQIPGEITRYDVRWTKEERSPSLPMELVD